MNNRKLFIGSLPWSVDDAKLAEIFAQAGNVISAQVVKDRETGRSRGFGFVEMSTDEEAQNAVKNLNGADVDGRKIVVNIARPREDR
ncbi:RNA-binding protein [Patescibacteria group bacterium]|nr:RNA-binding protein [Patescibacteria group bacterium]